MYVIEPKGQYPSAQYHPIRFVDDVSKDSENSDLFQDGQKCLESNASKPRFTYYAANWVALFLNILFFAWMTWQVVYGRTYCPDEPFCELGPPCVDKSWESWSDANSLFVVLPGKAIKYGSHTFDRDNSGHHTLTSAEKGFTGQVLRVSREELEEAGTWRDDAVELENGGYMASLGVMHELHCLVSRTRIPSSHYTAADVAVGLDDTGLDSQPLQCIQPLDS